MCSAADNLTTMEGLRAEVARLSGLLRNGTAVVPTAWRLSAIEERVFRALLAQDIVSTAAIVEAADTTPNATRVHILRLRRKLETHSIEIETQPNRRGWSLVDRERWAAILKPKSEGVQ